MNFLTAGIPLFRVFRIQVILSWMFLIYAAFRIVPSPQPLADALGMAIVFGIVLLHEFGHCFACRAVGGQANHIVLWPLGGLAFCAPPNERFAHLVTTAGGPLVNVILIPILWGLNRLVGNMNGAPELLVVILDFTFRFNRTILLFNLLPFYPMDGGRLLQEILWYIVGYQKSLMIAGMVGTVGGVAFMVLGLGLVSVDIPFIGPMGRESQPILLFIGLMAATSSFGIYKRSHEIAGWRKR